MATTSFPASATRPVPPRGRYAAGFVLALATSTVFALILSLYELAFGRWVRAPTLRWVLRTQMQTNLVAAAVAAAGLLASWEWRIASGDMAAFADEPARYVLMLVGAAAWPQ
jgi:hypothetical protein